ncbi:MAG TPA: hypothetical protein VGZ69_04630 [Candidatus Rhabdochlamydia sp.]|jgi:hypothetical protein|nr:hypothetical protein [Candidatus Rhabdochlamydia sp.]
MTITNGAEKIIVNLPTDFSLSKFLSKNKKALLIGFSVSLINFGLGMISGAYMQNAITQAGLASCSDSQGTNASFSWTTTLSK